MSQIARGTARLVAAEGEWKEYPPGTVYRCEIYLSSKDGGFVAAAALPGVIGRGESESEALENARQVAVEAVRSYQKTGRGIPWQQREPRADEVLRVVIVQP